ncbi:hypothetical protein OF375_03040 [Ureaplasma miroungigenitalium]|uniref:hypothetical protein n=1 Tax=Ureaplasma miroungigenitalium TaxID=1042321 RepID=UPI0021E90A48|nr:hypothetical protein [Ureaplasma miroungigenitalium]MCV3734541.1 hypothetical protein [Ureaplasma miroungigenitalium]
MNNQNSKKKKRRIAAAISVVSSLFMAGVVITATQLRWKDQPDYVLDEKRIEYRQLLDAARKLLKSLKDSNNLNYSNLIDDLQKKYWIKWENQLKKRWSSQCSYHIDQKQN